MEIIYFKEIESTHKYLLKSLKEKTVKPPLLVVADMQSGGVGSRGNRWISQKGNLFLSFCVDLKQLPKDLPLQSISIYFSYLLKELLSEKGSKVWVKWPNDFYIEDKKIGGTITAKIGEVVVCSIGINIENNPQNFNKLDIKIDRDSLLREFVKKIKKNILWKQVFSKYKIEFRKSKKYKFNLDGNSLYLESASLNDDGSVEIDGKRIYSLR